MDYVILTPMDVFRDISYTDPSTRDPFREFDLYLPHPHQHGTSPLLCFVHGGAWRSEDKSDHEVLARKLAASTRLPVVIPNYRLTTNLPDTEIFRHPGHAQDILQFLTFLLDWHAPPGGLAKPYDPQTLYIMGHSCSTHMLTSVFLDSSSISPSLSPPARLLQAVKAIVLSEGIYDIDLLLAKFPAYRDWFIVPPFGVHDSYRPFSTTTFPLRNSDIRWLIIHSKADSLIDLPQSEAMYTHLCNLYAENAEAHVHRNTDQLDYEHNELLSQDEFVGIVKDFCLHEDDIPEANSLDSRK